MTVAPEAPLIWERGRARTRGEVLGAAAAFTGMLAGCNGIINLCSDRTKFLIALIAGVTSRRLVILPPGRAPEVVQRVHRDHPDASLVVDAPDPRLDLPQLPVPSLEGQGEDAPRSLGEPSHDQPAVMVFTSGTTGEFQAHPKRWGDLVAGTRQSAHRLGIGPKVGIVGTVPPQHMFGLETTVLYPLVIGCSVHAGCPLFPADIAAALGEIQGPHRLLVTTPAHLRGLASHPGQVPTMWMILSATAPLAPDLARTLEERLGAPVEEIYGCTEGGSLATRRTVREVWQWLAGVRLVSPPPRPRVTGAHLPAPIPLADVLESLPDGGFRLLGRQAGHIKVAGKRTSLAELNKHLLEIPGVDDGTFIPPDEGAHAGPEARLAAVYVSRRIEPDEVIAKLALRLDRAFLPRPLKRVPALPRNELGKLPRSALLELLREQGAGPP